LDKLKNFFYAVELLGSLLIVTLMAFSILPKYPW